MAGTGNDNRRWMARTGLKATQALSFRIAGPLVPCVGIWFGLSDGHVMVVDEPIFVGMSNGHCYFTYVRG